MNPKLLQTIIHVLALVSGVCTLLAVGLTQPPFSLSPLVAGALALASAVATYVANQLPALGEASVETPLQMPPPPTTPTAPPA